MAFRVVLAFTSSVEVTYLNERENNATTAHYKQTFSFTFTVGQLQLPLRVIHMCHIRLGLQCYSCLELNSVLWYHTRSHHKSKYYRCNRYADGQCRYISQRTSRLYLGKYNSHPNVKVRSKRCNCNADVQCERTLS